MKKVGVLGSGVVGQVLAKGFHDHGYKVCIGSREPQKLEDWKKKNNIDVKLGTFEDAAAFGDILVFAVKGTAAVEALNLADINNFTNKIIIDATNPIDDKEAPINGVLKFFTNSKESLMEKLQKHAPKARFVKAFNSIGNSFMVNPDFNGQKPTMFICGNDDEAKAEVSKILDSFGWETEDMGKANSAGAIENLCILWCIPGFNRNQWFHAFKLLKKA